MGACIARYNQAEMNAGLHCGLSAELKSKDVGIVLAAGLGTRLRPSTERRPKPLIPVGAVEPLFFALYQFRRVGIRRVVINAHYLPEKMTAALEQWSGLLPELEIRVVMESPEILGTGGALLNIVKKYHDWFSGNVGILVQNGDTLAQMDISRLCPDLTKGQKKEQNSLAISFWPEHLAKYHPLWVDQADRWVGIGKTSPEEGSKPGHFLGVHYLSPSAVTRMQSDDFPVRPVDLFNGIYRPLVTEGQYFAAQTFFSARCASASEFWFDMTTQAYLLEAQRHVLDNLTAGSVWVDVLKVRYPNIQEIAPGIWVRSQVPRPGVRFESPAIMVDRCEDGPAYCLGPLTLGPNASLIHEEGQLETNLSLEDHRITNSVVFIQNPNALAMPKLIKDEVRIL